MQINRQILRSVKRSAVTGHAILIIAALVSGIATGKMMWLGSLEDHWAIRGGKIILGVGLIEGALCWTYHGIRKVFTNGAQRFLGYLFLFLLVCAILCNLFTERMLARGSQLNDFQLAWIDWAFDSLVVLVMLAIGAIQLFSDDARLERQALIAIGEEVEEKLAEGKGPFPAELESRETGQLSGKDSRRW